MEPVFNQFVPIESIESINLPEDALCWIRKYIELEEQGKENLCKYIECFDGEPTENRPNVVRLIANTETKKIIGLDYLKYLHHRYI